MAIESSRLRDLQQKFRELEPRLENNDTKKALSVMHGMIQELWRGLGESSTGGESEKMKKLSALYKEAPKMEGAALNEPLAEGSRAPDFALKDSNGRIVRLSDFKGSSVLLVFYPLDWSPGCSQQLDLYQHDIGEFEKRGIKLVGISVDSIYSHGAWALTRDILFPILSDFNPKGEVARKYKVYREPDGFSERALFLIDGDGHVRFSHVSPMINHIPDIYELFAKLDKILEHHAGIE